MEKCHQQIKKEEQFIQTGKNRDCVPAAGKKSGRRKNIPTVMIAGLSTGITSWKNHRK